MIYPFFLPQGAVIFPIAAPCNYSGHSIGCAQKRTALKPSAFARIWLQVLLVGLDHLLERVTRTTFEICPSFQLLQIFFTAFTGENLDVQPHGAVTLRRSEDFIDKGIDKLLGDLAVLTVALSITKHLADTLHIKTGVVQFGMGVSVAPIEILRQTNTNKAGVQEGKNAGMAPLAYRIVAHGVYCMPFFVNPNYAGKSGCTAVDIELLKLLIPHAYEQNRSAIRPDVRIRHAWYIEHKNILGSCPEYLLLDALTPKKLGNINDPSTSWNDYEDKITLPQELLDRVESCVDLVTL